MATLDQLSVEELLEEYNESERKVCSGGKAYREVPADYFENLKFWINQKGYELVTPTSGLSTVKKKK